MFSFLFLALFQFEFSSLFLALIWIKFSYPESSCYFIHHLVVFSWTLLSLSLSSLCSVMCLLAVSSLNSLNLFMAALLNSVSWVSSQAFLLGATILDCWFVGRTYCLDCSLLSVSLKWDLASSLSKVWYKFLARIWRKWAVDWNELRKGADGTEQQGRWVSTGSTCVG